MRRAAVNCTGVIAKLEDADTGGSIEEEWSTEEVVETTSARVVEGGSRGGGCRRA